MRACRTELARLCLSLLAASALSGAAPAAAQPAPGSPTPLLSPQDGGPPVVLVPSLPQLERMHEDDTIEVAPLAPVDTSWSGPLAAGKGGFPREMWRGTSRAFIVVRLPGLQPSASPVLQSLESRLLLSDAVAPAPGPGEPTADSGLMALRLDRLLALGIVAPALPLLEMIPDGAANESVARDAVELRFADNDTTGACSAVNQAIVTYANPYWARALIACQALAGDSAKAQLGQQLLADQKAPPDRDFDALIARIGSRAAKLPPLDDPTPMDLALLAAAKAPLPPETAVKSGLAALYGWAIDDKIPPAQRLAAAERAALLGSVPSDGLAAIYDAIAFKSEDGSTAAKALKSPADPRARARLYQLAKHAAPDIRQAAIMALLSEAQKRGAFMLTARLVAPVLAELPADNPPAPFAAMAARALIAAGHAEAAQPWLSTAQSQALLMVSRLAAPGPFGPGDNQLLKDATAELAAQSDAGATRADLLLALYTALDGAPILGGAVAAQPSPSLDTTLWNAQLDAAQHKRLGETVLTTALLDNDRGALTADPILLTRAVAALRGVGLEAEARRLAVEAALAAGI
jgi:hypothetical protein